MENSFNFKSIVRSSLITEKSVEKIKISTGKAFKYEPSTSKSMDISEITEGKSSFIFVNKDFNFVLKNQSAN